MQNSVYLAPLARIVIVVGPGFLSDGEVGGMGNGVVDGVADGDVDGDKGVASR